MHDFHFYHPIEIRYGDLDPQGHVNNAKYLTYFEQARIAYITHLGLWSNHNSFSEIGIILADVHVTFRAPLYFGQNVRVGAGVTRLGNKSLAMEYTLQGALDGQEFASGSTVLVTYDYHSGHTIAIPDRWRQAIASFENLPLFV
jgi:acyl-CoA thioester hydrolase